MPFIARGTQKPPLGAQVNPEHPFAQDLLVVVPFTDGPQADPFNSGIGPAVLRGPALSLLTSAMPILAPTLAGGHVWDSNLEGRCLVCSATGAAWNFGIGAGGTNGNWLPTAATTVCVIRRKRDTTNRASALFGDGTTAANRLAAHVPYSDGVVYWDFGGFSGANRLTVSGLTFSTTAPERWVFTAGPQGSAIWRNGVKLASQGTALTRTGTTDAFLLNSGSGEGKDNIDLNYVAIYNTQWDDILCRRWSAEPYAHLYPSRVRSLFVGDVAPGTAVKPTVYYHQQWRQAS